MKLKFESGTAAVEFALVLPLLLTVIFGIVEFSLILYDQAIITNACREAARAGIVLKKPKLTISEIQSVATNYCQAYLISFSTKPSLPIVTVQQPVPPAVNPDFSTPLKVTVSYTFSGLALGSLLSALNIPLTLTATSVMNNE